jgi:hypothetical protein
MRSDRHVSIQRRAVPGQARARSRVYRRAARIQTRLRWFKRFVIIKTGDRTYCVIAEWDSFQSIVAARPKMIAMLDSFRDTLEDLGGGLGVTDPVSGEAVLEM